MNETVLVRVSTIMLVFAIVATSAVLLLPALDDGPDVARVGDITVSRGLIDNGVSVEQSNGEAHLAYSGNGVDIVWMVRDLDQSVYTLNETGRYDTPESKVAERGRSLTIPDAGSYLVAVKVDGKEVASGKLVLDGSVRRHYSWDQTTLSGTYHYSVDIRYQYSAYLERHDSDITRHEVGDGRNVLEFAKADNVIRNVESNLRSAFLAVRGGIALDGQEYANYLLSFVQCCISSPDKISEKNGRFVHDPVNGSGDLSLYGTREYFAYPIETIRIGMGDEEDVAFLTTALFDAAGLPTGIAKTEGHILSYVGLADFSPTQWPGTSISVGRIHKSGQNIFFCDATTQSHVPAGHLDPRLSERVLDDCTVWIVSSGRL